MASDTGTLELERVHEERRRLEGRPPLGPEDRAPADELVVDTDPATRAAQIVQEVLAAAERRRDGLGTDGAVAPAAGTAAARARRIVEEVLAAAAEATGAETVTIEPDDEPEPLGVRADLVLLTAADPLVLLPGEAFDPVDGPYVPTGLPTPLGGLVERVLDSVMLDAPFPAGPAEVTSPDELATPTTISEAIRGAGESSNRHGVRWIVAGAVWVLAFGLMGPLAYKALIASADMTIELWDSVEPVAEQQVDVPEDELPPETQPGELQPEEAGAAG